MHTLVLNSFYQPIEQIPWKRALILYLQEKAEVLENYAGKFIRTVSKAFPIPSVIRLLRSNHRRRAVVFSRANVYTRDKGLCQYCSKKLARNEFTLDHVIPRRLGGQTKWDNVVCCCLDCNQKKGHLSTTEAKMPLKQMPSKPKSLPEQLRLSGDIPEDWVAYLRDTIYWHGALDSDE